MASVVKTFNYTGTLQQANIPPGTTSIDVYLWGGAGGGDGGWGGGAGGSGGWGGAGGGDGGIYVQMNPL